MTSPSPADELVERLRSSASRLDYAGDGLGYYTRADAFREREAAAIIESLTADNEALRAKLAEAMEVVTFYADPDHWRTKDSDGSLINRGFGLGFHRTGDGIMEVQASNCGQWVPSGGMVHGGHWHSDAGHAARRLVDGGQNG